MLLLREKEAKLYYLYMMSDGGISYGEELLFDTICADLQVNELEKNNVIKKCKDINNAQDVALDIIKSESKYDFSDPYIAKECARIAWNLVNLGYADKIFSEEEKEILSYLVKKWKVDDELFHEMIDTCDTIFALTKQKEWVKSTYLSENESDEKERMIDAEIESLLEDFRLSINEIEM